MRMSEDKMKVTSFSILMLISVFVAGCSFGKPNISDNSDTKIDIEIETDIDITADEEKYLSILSNEVKNKHIFNYLVRTEYQKNFEDKYRLHGKIYEDSDITDFFRLKNAFGMISQPENEFVYKGIKLVESYIYYALPIEIHEVPNGNHGNYYIASVDLSTTATIYELLLFSEDGEYLDKYCIENRYTRRGDGERPLYEYKEIMENIYGIVIVLDGKWAQYLTLVTIKNSKFEEIFTENIFGTGQGYNGMYDNLYFGG